MAAALALTGATGAEAASAASSGRSVTRAGRDAGGFVSQIQWRTSLSAAVRAVIVNPRTFPGRVIATHGAAIAGRSTVAAQSQPLGALAAVNADFFTINSALPDVAGVPTGLGVYAGEIESLPNGDRADLVLNGRHPARIENLLANAELHDRGSVATVLGINRQPGSNEDCGVPGFVPTRPPSNPRPRLLRRCSCPPPLLRGAPLPSEPTPPRPNRATSGLGLARRNVG